ncbi:MAG TPA: hypothetical protein VFP65_26105, partial [Anaeromyxobacteraceae bacterium]|nr:hypothetical protein [Anaeromyxobacteraceae bacterium]
MRSPHDVASLDLRRARHAAAARDAYPDRALLETVLPRFDAATQAIAGGVIVEGKAQDEVAADLGVTRRTVQSKLGQFLAIARWHLAVATAAAALAGCAGGPSATGTAAAASPPAAST